MLAIIKNNWNRVLQQKANLIVTIALTIGSVILAIIITNNSNIKGNIAVVGSTEGDFTSPYYNMIYLEEAPEKSALVQGRYDAVISIDHQGKYDIYTIKSEDFKEMLQGLLVNPSSIEQYNNSERKVGTNILGFMIMFLLMQGILYGRLFGEDKEKGMLERVAMSPIPFTKYLLGHGIFMWVLIFIPSFLVVSVAKIFGALIGFSIVQYGALIAIMALLSTSISIFLNSIFNGTDKANMIGSALVILTSILGGSFYSFTKSDSWFSKFVYLIPQKSLIDYADALEKSKVTFNNTMEIGYVIMISMVIITMSVVIIRRDYVYKS